MIGHLLFGAFIGVCVFLMVDGYKAHRDYRRARQRWFSEVNKYR
jgi:hypothetical protein